jgi:hypothetical protein
MATDHRGVIWGVWSVPANHTVGRELTATTAMICYFGDLQPPLYIIESQLAPRLT